MNALPGIGGSLFPGRFLLDELAEGVSSSTDRVRVDRKRRQLEAWWARAVARCGPATGLRALFDVVAMPLFKLLGYDVGDLRFERAMARARLETASGGVAGLVLLAWASHPSSMWRDVAAASRDLGVRWSFLFAPPFLSLVDCRGHAFRRSVDFTLPDVLDVRSFTRFWRLAGPLAFDARAVGGGQGRPEVASIDALVAAAVRYQDGVRTDLQQGVVEALSALQVALRQPPLRQSTTHVDEALTIVYRILFLLFAESRDLVPRSHPVYNRAYTVGSLCRDAFSSEPAAGLWDGLAAITRLSRRGCRTADLTVWPFNGHLFARAAAPSLEAARPSRRANRRTAAGDLALQRALVALASRAGRAGREPISYADLGVEQLGAVYERVLDLGPRTATRHSRSRKESGTFYTPRPLAEFVVRRTLGPLVDGQSADRILSLRVLDPAMGSGAFLVAACRYLAAAYERALVTEGRSAATDIDDDARANMRRLVAERCLWGVDVNPVAVQLARLSLWLTTLAHGKPLGFLDHRFRVGNSLVGASPDDLHRVLSRRGASDAPLPLFDTGELEHTMQQVSRPLLDMSARPDNTIEDVRSKEALWQQLSDSNSPIEPWRLAASLWCARWFWNAAEVRSPPPSGAGLRAALDAILKSDRTLPSAALAEWLTAARAIARSERCFHWPLEYADVFYDPSGRPRSTPGFDAVIGNPPWEMLRDDSGTPEPRPSTSSGRPERVEGRNRQLVRFIRESGLYPSCDRGHVNLYQPFLERALSLARVGGRVGLVLPWGLAVDDGAAKLRAKLFDQSRVETIVGLDNGRALFPIHRGLRFLVVVASPGGQTCEIRARFGVRTGEELDDLPGREIGAGPSAYPVRLTSRTLAGISGPARRIPDIRRDGDLALLARLTGEHPPLGAAAGWSARFGRELNATEDRASFGAHGLAVVEGKHIAPFTLDLAAVTHRIERRLAERALPDAGFDRPRLVYRDVSGVTNRLSLIAAIVPAGVVTTHTLFCLRTPVPLEQQHFLCGLFNSFVLNAIVRMLMGGHATTSLVEALPVPAWTGGARQRRIARLARRRAETPAPASPRVAALLQAAVARLYDLNAAEFEGVLEGFPLVPADERGHAARCLTRGIDHGR